MEQGGRGVADDDDGTGEAVAPEVDGCGGAGGRALGGETGHTCLVQGDDEVVAPQISGDDGRANGFRVAEDRSTRGERGRGRAGEVTADVDVACYVDHAAGVDHADDDIAHGAVEPRQLGLALDDGEALRIDGVGIAEVATQWDP